MIKRPVAMIPRCLRQSSTFNVVIGNDVPKKYNNHYARVSNEDLVKLCNKCLVYMKFTTKN